MGEGDVRADEIKVLHTKYGQDGKFILSPDDEFSFTFRLRVDGVPVALDVSLPAGYPDELPVMRVVCDHISRDGIDQLTQGLQAVMEPLAGEPSLTAAADWLVENASAYIAQASDGVPEENGIPTSPTEPEFQNMGNKCDEVEKLETSKEEAKDIGNLKQSLKEMEEAKEKEKEELHKNMEELEDRKPMSRQSTLGLEGSTFDWQISPQSAKANEVFDRQSSAGSTCSWHMMGQLSRQSTLGVEVSTFDWQISPQMTPLVENAGESCDQQSSLELEGSTLDWQISPSVVEEAVRNCASELKQLDNEKDTAIKSMGA